MLQPFYDPEKSYEENYAEGPFGIFADNEVIENKGKPEYDFLGVKVNSPFGIAAGPLVNSKFCKSAFEKGFDICVYKTVRSQMYPCHPYPNVVSVDIPNDESLAKSDARLVVKDGFNPPLSITNSFGVPSRSPEIWQADTKKAISYASNGQVLVSAFMGTVKTNQTPEEFIADHALAAMEAKSTGAPILEVNLSCPNIGNEGLICYDLDMTQKICEAIREEIGDTPLILKVGYYKNENDIKRLAEIADQYADAIACINTMQAEVVDKNGNQALPGEGRLRSGIAGEGIKWAGLEMTRKFKEIRNEFGYSYDVIGVGGVFTPEDFFEYRNAGADIVMSVTGAMWNPYLAKEIKERLE
jgi:dihydroorotate dehydrogenase (NAD+) catalytic subunit